MSDSTSSAVPVPYDPSVEQAEEGERETIAEVDATMAKIREKTFADCGHAMRSVHAKGQGYVRGRLQVEPSLPDELAQGLFSHPGAYDVLLRLSTNPGDILDDNVSVPRGLALKVVGVDGARLPGSEADTTQNFVFVDAPAFNAPSTKKFLSNLKPLAATTDKAPGLKRALSETLQVAEKVVEAFGGKSAKLVSMGGHAKTHPLGETYYTAAALRHGRCMAKLQLVPVSPALAALKDQPVDLSGKPDGLREAVASFLQRNEAVWELRAQLCTDLETMPIEDASVEWPEDASPYRTVARIAAEPQVGWSDALAAAVDDTMFFSPWRGLEAHRPLGNVMRARRTAYEQSAQFRSERNGRAVAEPHSLAGLPTG